jgi:hypothetical protein
MTDMSSGTPWGDDQLLYGHDPNAPTRHRLTAVAITNPHPRLAEEAFIAGRRVAHIPGEQPFEHLAPCAGWRMLMPAEDDVPSCTEVRGAFYHGPGDAGVFVHHNDGDAIVAAVEQGWGTTGSDGPVGDLYAVVEFASPMNGEDARLHERMTAELGVWCDAIGADWHVLPDTPLMTSTVWLPKGDGYIAPEVMSAATAHAGHVTPEVVVPGGTADLLSQLPEPRSRGGLASGLGLAKPAARPRWRR